jgi:hypothetical protein
MSFRTYVRETRGTMERKAMQKPFRVVSISVVSVLMLLCIPWLCSQEAGGKDPADKGVAEQKTVEKTRTPFR